MSCYKGKYHDELISNAKRIKMLVAVDEYVGKSLPSTNIEYVEANRHVVRELLSYTPSDHLLCLKVGVILSEGAFYKKKTASGKPFVKVMEENGVRLGIEFDKGTVELAGTKGETTTLGIDLLAQRCHHYYCKGARLAKWRCEFKIGPAEPSEFAINENANGLARYAIICQENGLVPIVQPEILVDGPHDISRCADVTERVLAACYKALNDHRVLLEGTLLRCNMVTPGSESADKVSPEVVARYTVRALWRTVPAAVPAVFFLSGGQSEEEGRLSLNAMNKHKTKENPWLLSRSFGRDLQQWTLQSTLLPWFRANRYAGLGVY
ncbi:hypothetical protein MKW94_023273 [Papaver nudicaule]|uniref:fructose-bisphosphate aldolase n=1 Tax=Papaver nudicaule TaxID=74823 RepID=A0AA41VT49_PAPNU|nr:hypothetical protein [Papaver nudicaule]